MNAKNIKFFKNSLNNKNSISFSHIKFLLSLFFSQKMMEFWSFFLSCFWGPQIFWGPQKRLKFWILDLWVCIKKVGLGAGWYGKSVLYLRLLSALLNWFKLVYEQFDQSNMQSTLYLFLSRQARKELNVPKLSSSLVCPMLFFWKHLSLVVDK